MAVNSFNLSQFSDRIKNPSQLNQDYQKLISSVPDQVQNSIRNTNVAQQASNFASSATSSVTSAAQSAVNLIAPLGGLSADAGISSLTSLLPVNTFTKTATDAIGGLTNNLGVCLVPESKNALSSLTNIRNTDRNELGDPTTSGSPPKATVDKRIRLRAIVGKESETYGNGILNPIKASNGLIFPYAPTITMSGSAEYSALSPAQGVQDYYSYSRTPSITYNIQGIFTSQDQSEAAYALAAIHFCKTMTKSDFGEQAGANAGLPPRILLLSGYGTYIFNDLPVIFKSYSIQYDNTVDYVEVQGSGGNAWVPTLFTIGIEVIVQNTPDKLRKSFSLDKFKTGALLAEGGYA